MALRAPEPPCEDKKWLWRAAACCSDAFYRNPSTMELIGGIVMPITIGHNNATVGPPLQAVKWLWRAAACCTVAFYRNPSTMELLGELLCP